MCSDLVSTRRFSGRLSSGLRFLWCISRSRWGWIFLSPSEIQPRLSKIASFSVCVKVRFFTPITSLIQIYTLLQSYVIILIHDSPPFVKCAGRDSNPQTAYTVVPSKSTVYAFSPPAQRLINKGSVTAKLLLPLKPLF
jgi:hypothetical protein